MSDTGSFSDFSNRHLSELYDTLQERALQAESLVTRISHDDVMREACEIIKQGCKKKNLSKLL